MDLASERKSYELAKLDEHTSPSQPLSLFEQWMQEAFEAQVPEPNAMSLATVGADGRPSSRIVLIKGLDERGLVWYTNYESRKGEELKANPWAALMFHWVAMERVVRIEGQVERVGPQQSDAYFASRPLASRLAAVASPQSRVVASRSQLEAAFDAASKAHGQTPARPAYWGGYCLKPERWEFWQGRRSRLHDRLVYRHQALACSGPAGVNSWVRERLAP